MGSREEPAHADLMPTPTSARRGYLKKTQGRGWACTPCPETHNGQGSFHNYKAALHHEPNAHDHKPATRNDDGHLGCVDGAHAPGNDLGIVDNRDKMGWDEIGHARLTSEGLRRWEMHAHVDHVYDLVPFWQRGIDAAERGEVLRLEEFLEKMEGDGGWRTANEVLGVLCGWKASPSERRWGESKPGGWGASQRGAWELDPHGWGTSEGDGWGMASDHLASDATESSCGRDSGWDVQEEWPMAESDLKMGRAKNTGRDGRPRIKTARAVGGSGGREELRHFVDSIARQESVNEERRREMHLFFEMPVEQKVQKIQETIRFLRTHA